MTSAADRVRAELQQTIESTKERFAGEQRVLSFDEYLNLVWNEPRRFTRDAARYLKDCFDHFGSYSLSGEKDSRDVRFGGERFALFDLPFLRDPEKKRQDSLIGQEEIQRAFYRALSNFEREGRINRLVMLHGPNGSAKSTFVRCMMRGLEHYSAQPEGALYRFSWVFPRGKDGRAVGFGSSDESLAKSESYAHLPDSMIELRIASEIRENPLLLLPELDRKRFLRDAYAAHKLAGDPPLLLRDGDLSSKNKQIFEALLAAYRGDLSRVFAHVRVERYSLSERYRTGAVTVGPQMAVDASERQISMDRSLGSLPASLSSLSLYSTQGELVEATAGILEFSDLLKRPLDAWRYLLLAVEEGELPLQASVLPLNTVFVATSNDLHLHAFREHHEYRSFRGRMQFIQVPYLIDVKQEQAIYDTQIAPQIEGPIAPHATYLAALWAVLTRLRPPQSDHYENQKLGQLVAQLSPLEKVDFLSDLSVPKRYTHDDAALLRNNYPHIKYEYDGSPVYEGGSGASPREVRLLLLEAAQHNDVEGLFPTAVLDSIAELCAVADYDYLKEVDDSGYRNAKAFVLVARERWLDRVDEEFRQATGLVSEAQYLELFERYVTHVSYWVKQERMHNQATGKDDGPDAALMENVEKLIHIQSSADQFRKELIGTIAAHGIDNPGKKPELPRLFPNWIGRLREATYGARKAQLAEIAHDVLLYTEALAREEAKNDASAKNIDASGDDNERDHSPRESLDDARTKRAQRVYESFQSLFGYVPSHARRAIFELQRARYID